MKTAVFAAALALFAVAGSGVAHAIPATRVSVKACVIGGLGYPMTSPVAAIAQDLRARGLTVVEGGPDEWPEISSCDIIIGHSMGVDVALKAAPGKRLIVSIDAFTHRDCPKGATVIDIYNTNHSFPTTGPLPCAQRRIGIDSGPGLGGHINAPLAARPLAVQAVDDYLSSSAR